MSYIFQLPLTWQRLCRLGQLELQTLSMQGQARCACEPRQRTTPDSGRRNGMFSFQSAQRAGPTGFPLLALAPYSVPERKTYISIQNSFFT